MIPSIRMTAGCYILYLILRTPAVGKPRIPPLWFFSRPHALQIMISIYYTTPAVGMSRLLVSAVFRPTPRATGFLRLLYHI